VEGGFFDWSTVSARDATVAGGVRTERAAPSPWARPITIGGGRLTARVQVWHEPGRSKSAGGAVRAIAASLADLGSDVPVTTELPTPMTRTEER
jgi:hypothetical protein